MKIKFDSEAVCCFYLCAVLRIFFIIDESKFNIFVLTVFLQALGNDSDFYQHINIYPVNIVFSVNDNVSTQA